MYPNQYPNQYPSQPGYPPMGQQPPMGQPPMGQPPMGQPSYNPSMGGMPQYPQQPGYPMQPGMPPQQSGYGYQQPAMPGYAPQGPGMHSNYPASPMMSQPGYAPPAHGYGAAPNMGRATGTIRLQLAGTALKNKDLFTKSDPFFTISRSDAHGKSLGQPIHKSEVCHNNLNPVWQPLTTSVQHFCGGDYHQQLKIEVFDYDSTDKPDLMGHVITTLREIMDAQKTGRKFTLVRQRFMSSGKAGEIYVKDFALWQESLPM